MKFSESDEILLEIRHAVKRIERKLFEMSDTLDDVLTDVAAESTVDDSIITLLNGIAAELKAAGSDPAKITAVRTAIQANIAKITAAVTANTPAAPPATA